MPVLFVGHGSPMNAIDDHAYHRSWRQLGDTLPRPLALQQPDEPAQLFNDELDSALSMTSVLIGHA